MNRKLMTEARRTWRAQWDIIPLWKINDRYHAHGKRPYGKGWQQEVWSGKSIARALGNGRYNLGIRHGSPIAGKLCTVGIDFDGDHFCTYGNMVKLIRQKTFPWMEEFLGIFETTALMQSSPGHQHMLLAIDTPIRKTFIHYKEEMIEVLGQGNQSVIPPSVCRKPEVYPAFERYWIQGRETIQHCPNALLQEFIEWAQAFDPINAEVTVLGTPNKVTFRKYEKKICDLAEIRSRNSVKLTRTRQKRLVTQLFDLGILYEKPGLRGYNKELWEILIYLNTLKYTIQSIKGIMELIYKRIHPKNHYHDMMFRILTINYFSTIQSARIAALLTQ